MLEMFWWLLVGHAVADFWAQGQVMATSKNRHMPIPVPPEMVRFYPAWPYWMTVHALIHGGAVALVTQSVPLGVAETVAHWGIDFGKCERWYNFHVDQALHIAFKVAWVIVATR